MRADLLRNGQELDVDSVLDVLHAAERQREGLQQIDGLKLRNELQAFAGLRVVDAAIDRHQHEAVGIAHVCHALVDGADPVLDITSRQCIRVGGGRTRSRTRSMS